MYLNVKWSKLNADSSFLPTYKQRLNHLLAHVKRLSRVHLPFYAFQEEQAGARGSTALPMGIASPRGPAVPAASHMSCAPTLMRSAPCFRSAQAKGQGRAAWRDCLTALVRSVCEKKCRSSAGLPCSLTLHRSCRTNTAL